MYVKKHAGYSPPRYFLSRWTRTNGRKQEELIYNYGNTQPHFYQPVFKLGLCENIMREYAGADVDLIIDDPPYGKTKQEWDTEPDWEELTELYYDVLSDSGLLVIFGQQPSLISAYNAFTNDGFQFRYELIWEKKNPAWVSPAQPKPAHENIFIFAKKGVKATETTFNTKNVMEDASFVCPDCREKHRRTAYHVEQSETSQSHKGAQSSGTVSRGKDKRYPRSVLEYHEAHPEMTDDPKTGIVGQKPVRLMRWLIMALSNRGDTILDPHAGSGSTLYTAIPLCRRSIGIEANPERYENSKDRLDGRFNELTELKHGRAVEDPAI